MLFVVLSIAWFIIYRLIGIILPDSTFHQRILIYGLMVFAAISYFALAYWFAGKL